MKILYVVFACIIAATGVAANYTVTSGNAYSGSSVSGNGYSATTSLTTSGSSFSGSNYTGNTGFYETPAAAVVETPVTHTSSSSGGGGERERGISTETAQSISQNWDVIEQGTILSVPLTATDFALVEADITFTAEARNFELTFTNLGTKPPQNKSAGTTYQYFTIEHPSNLTAMTSKLSLTFSVSNEWLGNQSVELARLENNTWTGYPAILVSSTDTQSLYNVTVPGFSYFAIRAVSEAGEETLNKTPETQDTQPAAPLTGEATAPLQTQETPKIEEQIQTQSPSKTSTNWWPWLLAIILAGVVGTIFVKKKQAQESVYEEIVVNQVTNEKTEQDTNGELQQQWDVITRQLRGQGYSEEQIKNYLVQNGWDPVQAEQELLRIK